VAFIGAVNGVATPFSSGRHVNDFTPALIVAGQDIDNLSLSIPKATDIIAGRDINDLLFFAQNLNPTDLTLVSAGRDINASASSTIEVGGPGRLDVIAGRNIDLGFSSGVTTIGNTLNPNLVSTGADLTVVAGLNPGADYSGFVSKIIAPDPTSQTLLISYIEDLTGQTDLNYATASSEFAGLSADQQRPLIDEVFFDELSLSGLQANANPQVGFSLGYAAIDALLPNSRSTSAANPSPYQGDLSLTFSRIYTTNGGTISILVPGGELDVGLANPPASVAAKLASDLGIVAQGAGDIDIYTLGDVNVNSSRIFTLGGGNILIWSDEGSIDAGRGSKSSVSAPPPQVLVDASGNVTLSFSGAVAGSGIRTIQIDPSVPAGNVNLVAPEGTVNAGDAGIGAAGDINIAAQNVLGVNNINFGGTATGVPPPVSNLGASLSGATSTASSATNSTTSAVASTTTSEAATSLSQSALSWLDVFVSGLGEENCKPDDLECLKRQKH
jgi:filamentous hemagglutinin